MTRMRVIMEDENGTSLSSNCYDLGADFCNIDKVEDAILSISGTLLTDVTRHILNIEQAKFLKKVSTKLMVHTL